VKTHRIAALAVVVMLAASGAVDADGPRSAPGGVPLADTHRVHRPFRGERFARTELFFGSARAGGEVTEAEFKQFLDAVITPRFPDGLTLLTGRGQFLGSAGPVQERSFLLILLYPEKARGTSSTKIEEIRAQYKHQFNQKSVLRSDRCCERAGF
jgi:hypothetical protein